MRGRRFWRLIVVGALLIGLVACEPAPSSGPQASEFRSAGNELVAAVARRVADIGDGPTAEPVRPPVAPATGSVWRWGRYEKLVHATNSRAPELVTIGPAAPRMVAVATGLHQGIALDGFGAIWQWEEADVAEIAGRAPAEPRRVRAGNGRVTAIAAGDHHFLALREDGEVWAWGYNTFGELGDGTDSPRADPLPVPGLPNVVAIAAGSRHSLALGRDGTVWVWGNGALGELGHGQQVSSSLPVRVPGLPLVRALAGGGRHSLAVAVDGAVWAWGLSLLGSTAEVSTIHLRPVRVEGITGAVSAAAGWKHSLVLTETGQVWAWGYNPQGELGIAPDPSFALFAYDLEAWIDLPVGAPQVIPKLDRVVAIAAGERHSLALRADGSVWAWGSNLFGELGAMRNPVRWFEPEPVPGLLGVTAISARGNRSLALQGPPVARLPAPQFGH